MSNLRFLYRYSKTATITDDDLKENPSKYPLTNRQIDGNFNSIIGAIDEKADLKDPVFPDNSVVNINAGYLLIPIFSDDDIPEEYESKAIQEGSFRFNPQSFTLETYYNDAWNALTAKAAGGNNNSIFWLNDQKVISDYTIPSGKNAMTAGPITINRGVTVSITDGCTWTVV